MHETLEPAHTSQHPRKKVLEGRFPSSPIALAYSSAAEAKENKTKNDGKKYRLQLQDLQKIIAQL